MGRRTLIGVAVLGVLGVLGCHAPPEIVQIRVRPSCSRISMNAEVTRMRVLSDQIDLADAKTRPRLLAEQDALALHIHRTITDEIVRCP